MAGFLEINPTFAAGLGLRDKQTVSVELIPARKVPSAATVFVDPLTPDDWEILVSPPPLVPLVPSQSSFLDNNNKKELHAGLLEEQLLNQVKVVFPGEILAIWILSNTLIRLRVGLPLSSSSPPISLFFFITVT